MLERLADELCTRLAASVPSAVAWATCAKALRSEASRLAARGPGSITFDLACLASLLRERLADRDVRLFDALDALGCFARSLARALCAVAFADPSSGVRVELLLNDVTLWLGHEEPVLGALAALVLAELGARLDDGSAVHVAQVQTLLTNLRVVLDTRSPRAWGYAVRALAARASACHLLGQYFSRLDSARAGECASMALAAEAVSLVLSALGATTVRGAALAIGAEPDHVAHASPAHAEAVGQLGWLRRIAAHDAFWAALPLPLQGRMLRGMLLCLENARESPILLILVFDALSNAALVRVQALPNCVALLLTSLCLALAPLEATDEAADDAVPVRATALGLLRRTAAWPGVQVQPHEPWTWASLAEGACSTPDQSREARRLARAVYDGYLVASGIPRDGSVRVRSLEY